MEKFIIELVEKFIIKLCWEGSAFSVLCKNGESAMPNGEIFVASWDVS